MHDCIFFGAVLIWAVHCRGTRVISDISCCRIQRHFCYPEHGFEQWPSLFVLAHNMLGTIDFVLRSGGGSPQFVAFRNLVML